MGYFVMQPYPYSQPEEAPITKTEVRKTSEGEVKGMKRLRNSSSEHKSEGRSLAVIPVIITERDKEDSGRKQP